MRPLIALVGRQNVGKSTLFNRLTGASKALVARLPGLTRDRQYGRCTLAEQPFMMVDTGGAHPVADGVMAEQVEHQLWFAVEEADIVLLVVDGRSGLNVVDEELALRLRRTGKSWVLLVNKVDGLDADVAMAEFASLGAHCCVPLSATHGLGVTHLIEVIVGALRTQPSAWEQAQEGIPLAVIGRPNTGKSTLVNCLLDTHRMVVSDEPGTTRDSIYIPCELFGHRYLLIDTAGVRRRPVQRSLEKRMVSATMDALQDAQIAILMIDANEGWVSQDARMLDAVLQSGCALVLAANKWDMLDAERASETRAHIQRGLRFASYVPCMEVSAERNTGLKPLFKKLHHVYEGASRRIATPQINNILREAVAAHPPPLLAGRRIKLRYAHSGGTLPPVIIIHGSRAESIDHNYRSYLEHSYRDALNLDGTPIRLVMRNSHNPYMSKP